MLLACVQFWTASGAACSAVSVQLGYPYAFPSQSMNGSSFAQVCGLLISHSGLDCLSLSPTTLVLQLTTPNRHFPFCARDGVRGTPTGIYSYPPYRSCVAWIPNVGKGPQVGVCSPPPSHAC